MLTINGIETNNIKFLDDSGFPYGVKHTDNRPHHIPYVWDVDTLAFVPMEQSIVKTDTLNVTANFPGTQPVSAVSLPLPSGAATSAKQDSSLTLQGTLESLVDTLQELVQRLAPLGGSISMVGGQALRVSYGGGTFATSGPQTSAEFIAAHHVAGRNYPFVVALHNMAAQANINNVTAA